MAVLDKDAFMSLLQNRIGDDTSDEAMSFIEDMTDTFNDLETRASSSGTEEWEQKYNDLDKTWREKYKARFFSSEEIPPTNEGGEAGKVEEPAEEKTFDDLFVESED